ncbi:hypothetical protein JZ751_013590 [Albula glossodonta]|uniref:LisH domain-containing protein n=1 Tax=Albula glossodonta TaxID=121402 RepID=A0A8T2NV83_9TELE|nr:hypothetical protein JZ751_013590 [Albula glossodonta]
MPALGFQSCASVRNPIINMANDLEPPALALRLMGLLALYVYEYLLHVGAQKSAQTFLSDGRRTSLSESPQDSCTHGGGKEMQSKEKDLPSLGKIMARKALILKSRRRSGANPGILISPFGKAPGRGRWIPAFVGTLLDLDALLTLSFSLCVDLHGYSSAMSSHPCHSLKRAADTVATSWGAGRITCFANRHTNGMPVCAWASRNPM